jgi:ubiquinone/menaquinone biosynthesis C-methylase UbiE
VARKPQDNIQTMKKGEFRMTYADQVAAVPKPFRNYYIQLAEKNGYYGKTFMLEWANGLEETLVLEAGCGLSSTLGRREKPLKKLVGIDPLREDLKINTVVWQKTQGVLEHLPYADGTFGGVYCDSVFEHISDPALVVGEFYRVLKPGGRVIINTNSVFNPFMFPNKLLTVAQREWVKKTLHIQSEGTYPAPYRINTKRKLVNYLSRAGFTEIEIIRWGLPAMYRPKWALVAQLMLEKLAESPLFCGYKHRLMATCVKKS